MGAGTVGSYEVESNGWTLQVTGTELGNTIVWLTGHGQEHELIYPSATPFVLRAQGYEPRIITGKKNEPAVIWERSEREPSFIWMCSVGHAQWVEPDLTGRDFLKR